MEVAALAGLLAVGYALTKSGGGEVKTEAAVPDNEAFANPRNSDFPYGGQPPPTYQQVRTPPGQPTIPGKPRQPNHLSDGEMGLYYDLPTGGSIPANPYTQPDLFQKSLVFADPNLPPQAPLTAVTPQVRMNNSDLEAPPVYNSGKSVISALSGMPMTPDEFTHNNMVPFYRGAPKQNMADNANRNLLDNMVGTGHDMISKREQAPLFDPHREPTGNVFGMENMTDFYQDRMFVPTSRANERPVEPVRVGPGLSQGYTQNPIGGFQQFEMGEVAKQRLSVDETRVASDPKITYEGRVIPGKSLALQRGEIGETRKYHPDTFYINQDGERNFVSVGENSAQMERATEVLKFQSREETSEEFTGPATAADFKETYNVPSFRAPMTQQHDSFGLRNADGSMYGTRNTDAPNNDFGRAGYDLPVNQRNVISERGQALNLTVAGGPKALTVYDPNDVARTTIRETTGANDRVGVAAPANAATKLTVYDPTDIMRVTHRNTMAEVDTALNVTRAGVPGKGTLAAPDGARLTTKQQVSANSRYDGIAGPAVAKLEQVYDPAYAMRTNPVKEIVSAGRRPVAGNGGLPIFNGEDNMNITRWRVDVDSLNDRSNQPDRVVGIPIGAAALGEIRPRQPGLSTDISRDVNVREILNSLSDNPYNIDIRRAASSSGSSAMVGGGPAAMAAVSLGSAW
jgi:hypothetical protein